MIRLLQKSVTASDWLKFQFKNGKRASLLPLKGVEARGWKSEAIDNVQ